MKYYIGVDGGGTKTAICAACADSSVLLSEVTTSASWREYGIGTVLESIKKVIDAFPMGEDGYVAGIAMGLPYYGESEDGDRELELTVPNAFPGIPLYITNDVEVGWAGSLGLSPGINVVAGTGSIVFGKNELGETARCGGWSEFFGDEGSCYWVGRKVLEVFSKQADGRVAKDELYDIVRKGLSLKSDFDIIDLIYSQYMNNRDKVASLQLFAKAAAFAGSPSAVSLYKEAAHELCSLVGAISNSLRFRQQPFIVSYSGGLFKTGDLVLPHFIDGIEEMGAKVVAPRFEPMYGALLLAFEKYNPEGIAGLKKRLMEE